MAEPSISAWCWGRRNLLTARPPHRRRATPAPAASAAHRRGRGPAPPRTPPRPRPPSAGSSGRGSLPRHRSAPLPCSSGHLQLTAEVSLELLLPGEQGFRRDVEGFGETGG